MRPWYIRLSPEMPRFRVLWTSFQLRKTLHTGKCVWAPNKMMAVVVLYATQISKYHLYFCNLGTNVNQPACWNSNGIVVKPGPVMELINRAMPPLNPIALVAAILPAKFARDGGGRGSLEKKGD